MRDQPRRCLRVGEPIPRPPANLPCASPNPEDASSRRRPAGSDHVTMLLPGGLHVNCHAIGEGVLRVVVCDHPLSTLRGIYDGSCHLFVPLGATAAPITRSVVGRSQRLCLKRQDHMRLPYIVVGQSAEESRGHAASYLSPAERSALLRPASPPGDGRPLKGDMSESWPGEPSPDSVAGSAQSVTPTQWEVGLRRWAHRVSAQYNRRVLPTAFPFRGGAHGFNSAGS